MGERKSRAVEVICVSVCWYACAWVFLFLEDCVHVWIFFTCVSLFVWVLLACGIVHVCVVSMAGVCVCACRREVQQLFSALPSLFIRKWWWGVRPHLIKEKIPSPINLINPTPEKEKLKEACLCVCVCLCVCMRLCEKIVFLKLDSQRGLPNEL